jgi:acetyl esterase/lipase
MLKWIMSGLVLAGMSAAALAADTPAAIALWPNGAPGSEGKGDIPENVVESGGNRNEVSISSIHHPSMIPYLPSKEKASGVAVVVMPGGGHRNLAMTHEGYNVGLWLADHGIAAFVLKYRLAREEGSTYTIDGHALMDVQRAIRLVHQGAREWNINPEAIGVMGFSAGGELAALASLRADDGIPQPHDPVDRASCRPKFQALIYPGQSQRIQPTKDSPPVFLACGNLDRQDISEGLANAYLLFKKAGVSAELHIYAKTGHGFGIRPTDKPPVSEWPMQFVQWLGNQGFITK